MCPQVNNSSTAYLVKLVDFEVPLDLVCCSLSCWAGSWGVGDCAQDSCNTTSDNLLLRDFLPLEERRGRDRGPVGSFRGRRGRGRLERGRGRGRGGGDASLRVLASDGCEARLLPSLLLSFCPLKLLRLRHQLGLPLLDLGLETLRVPQPVGQAPLFLASEGLVLEGILKDRDATRFAGLGGLLDEDDYGLGRLCVLGRAGGGSGEDRGGCSRRLWDCGQRTQRVGGGTLNELVEGTFVFACDNGG